MQPREPRAVRRHEVADAQVLERFVPALAPFRGDTFGDGVRDLVLVRGAPDELHELRLRHADLTEQRRAQARRKVILTEVAATHGRARFVDGARQEHEARESRAWIARRSPAQADRAHRLDGSLEL